MFAALMAEATPIVAAVVVLAVNGGEKVWTTPSPTWIETDPVNTSPAAATVLKLPPEVCEEVNVKASVPTLASKTFAATASCAPLLDRTTGRT